MYKNIKLTLIGIATVTLAFMCSCSKRTASCYDEALYQAYQNKYCTMDCPGVTGCDGKFYCNECIANTQGIRVE